MRVSLSIRVLLLTAICAANIAAFAQNPPPISNSTSTESSRVLTAAQISGVLQQHPELIVDLKSVVANQLQQQGLPAQADSITDEQLAQLIATSVPLRAGVTTWLQARGYVPATDKHLNNSDERENEAVGPRTPRSSSTRLQPDLTLPEGAPVSDPRLDSPSPSPPLPTVATSTTRRTPSQQPRSEAADANTLGITDSPNVLRRPTPYNLLALRDLYTQLPTDSTKLKRFGSEVFTDRSNSAHDTASIDVPVGPDYILGPGDSVVINMWGGLSQSFTRTVDREGKLALPESGSFVVAGLSLARTKIVLEAALKQQYRNAQIDITLTRLRTVRIYVVGDVQRPGAYDLSALATPLNALYAAGGPTSVGSLRIIKHYRGQHLVREVDLYDFFLHGLRMDDERLAAGDTLLIPPAGPQVAISGAVKRPAIYELHQEQSLAECLNDAGGATVAASLNHIVIDRIQPNQQRITLTLDQPANSTPAATLEGIAAFKVKDGDRIHVNAILPYSERIIYLEGHVARPGKLPYREGLQLSDVLHSYTDLLPEPATKGDIVRLVPPDLHAETTQFDIADVLIGNVQLDLQPFDTIRIYGRYEVDSPQVTVRGEVLRPGVYPLSRGMTTAQLVRMAGGFKRDALLDSADLTSYSVQDGRKITSQRSSVSISAAMQSAAADVALKPGDILTIHQISGWSDIGSSVVINGEVTYPGSYGLQEGEHLSSVLRRAGGLRGTAYANGSVLVRLQVKELEEKSREELIREIETTSVSARLKSNLSGQDEAAVLQAATQQQNDVLQRLRNQPASGRLVIQISSDIDSWANTPADIELRSGDILTVPKSPSFVLVSGQVYNASAITFVPGHTAGWYLKQAGGTNDVANNKEIFVVHANGSVVGRRSGGAFSGSVLNTKLEPGDVIVVPQKIIGGSLLWRNLLTVAQITSSIAITAAVAGVL